MASKQAWLRPGEEVTIRVKAEKGGSYNKMTPIFIEPGDEALVRHMADMPPFPEGATGTPIPDQD